MKTSKKLLIIGIGLGIIALVAGILAWGLTVFGLPYWPIFTTLCLIQVLSKIIFDRYVEYDYVKKGLDEYNKKPYKEFIVPLTCQVCGKTDNVTMDLSETEYRCTSCQRKNAIYVTFATAAMGIETTSAS